MINSVVVDNSLFLLLKAINRHILRDRWNAWLALRISRWKNYSIGLLWSLSLHKPKIVRNFSPGQFYVKFLQYTRSRILPSTLRRQIYPRRGTKRGPHAPRSSERIPADLLYWNTDSLAIWKDTHLPHLPHRNLLPDKNWRFSRCLGHCLKNG